MSEQLGGPRLGQHTYSVTHAHGNPQLWVPQNKREKELWKRVQQKAIKMLKVLEHLSKEKKLQPEEEVAQGDLIICEGRV